jgi:hypothetical protein
MKKKPFYYLKNIFKREALLALVLEFSALIMQLLLGISTALLIISNLP